MKTLDVEVRRWVYQRMLDIREEHHSGTGLCYHFKLILGEKYFRVTDEYSKLPVLFPELKIVSPPGWSKIDYGCNGFTSFPPEDGDLLRLILLELMILLTFETDNDHDQLEMET